MMFIQNSPSYFCMYYESKLVNFDVLKTLRGVKLGANRT
jgi:hypothetical protein